VLIAVKHLSQVAGIDGIKNGFTLTSTGGLTIATKAGGGGLCTSGDGKCTAVQTSVGTRDDGADYLTYMFRFGSDCTVPAAGVNSAVSFYDLDYGSGETVIKVTIKDTAPNGAVRWLIRPMTWQAAQPSYAASYKPPSADGTVSSIAFRAEQNHKYILYVENVGPHLLMQVGTPYDGAFYTANCPVPPPPTCSLTITPAEPDPLTPIAFKVSYSTTIAATLNLTFTDKNGAAQSASQAVASGGAPVTFTFNPPPGGFATGTSNAAATITSANGTGSCAGSTTVAPEPYLTVYGADVIAGEYAKGGVCTTSAADIASWNHDGTAAFGAGSEYAGAGGKIGVFASGNIGHFSSGLNITDLKPTGLSFANTTTSGTTYGGQFASGLPTGCDFTSGKAATESYTNANHQLAGDSLANNVDKYIMVTGADVYISGNIAYANSGGGWTKLGDIPSFKLVVDGGDIYIGKSVDRLDGLYVAMPKPDGTKGEIFTCAPSAYTPADQSQNSFASDCSTPLNIYGAFVAKKVHFDRTFGTVGQARGTDSFNGTDWGAEQFIYSPEMWLPNGSDADPTPFRYYQGLPPIL
jgi:hypothetical protein